MGGRGQQHLEALRFLVLALLDEAITAGARQFKACEVLGLSERTIQRWRQQEGGEDLRQGPKTSPHALSKAEKEHLVEVMCTPEFRDLSPAQIVPILAERGVYLASESTMYRLLKENRMQHHRQRSKKPNPKKPTPHQATQANQVWCWDITYLPTLIRGQYLYLYLFEDLFSRKIVGWSVEPSESAQLASELLHRTCAKEGIRFNQLVLHSDNGAPMKGSTMQATMQRLGVERSYSRPSVSDDNPYVESLFRTMKYHVEMPREGFLCAEQASLWVQGFVQWYNEDHRHSGLKFVTPSQRHEGADLELLKRRRQTYEAAKVAHPDRWKGRQVRDWTPDEVVYLNPAKAA